MSMTFRVPFNMPPEELLRYAKSQAISNGWHLAGDTESGSFSGGGASGYYHREGEILLITMTDKPWIASWSDVEYEIRKLFS